ncbi:L-asparagine permease, partial [Salmonella enterica subsp. enterica serovar Derby]
MMTHTTQRSHEDNPQGHKVSVTRDDPRAATIEEIQPIVDRGDQGYAETLTNRQVQMMAIGGAIGVGLFLGAGSRLRSAGPAVLIS